MGLEADSREQPWEERPVQACTHPAGSYPPPLHLAILSSIWPSVRGHRRVGRHSTRVQEDHSPPPQRGLAGPPPVTVL